MGVVDGAIVVVVVVVCGSVWVVVVCVGDVDGWMGVVDVLRQTVVVCGEIVVVGITVDPWVVLDSVVLVGAPSYNNS
jgi:hypothetical protein